MLLLTGALMLACLVLGISLDLLLGEARRWHPLVGFGKLANTLEAGWNRDYAGRFKGGVAWALIVLPLVLAAQFILIWSARHSLWLAALLHAFLLYFCLGLRSLYEHTAPIAVALQEGDLATARRLTSYIVSRDTSEANEEDLAKASVESLLENGCDAVFGTLFWFVVAGGAGALLYRLANTLDAMWGYKTPRLLRFGCVAARMDDVLNWLPARLTAISYALMGNTRLALQCWRQQSPAWPSPNAGPVMASGAGALGLALGGRASYDGVVEQRPPLGLGRAANASDIARAWRLLVRSTCLWIVCLILFGLLGLFLLR
ncbi:adenosylcobinamide-phosphate synthase CbiB [Undibacterium sp.]|uniref:adenosylcobinamide-phosphate synthase CbiB n=1 Tax=Undibacterium sp. TaxID=1914977 RepID=UPI0025D4269A|nr:adenosylcobinamide-phosphate synthase CbiB [Undibacterium sp.]